MSIEFIAEFCQNHNGDAGLLSEMVHAAAESGARTGKMQTIFADNLTYRPKFETGIEIDGRIEVIRRPYEPEYERLKTLEIDFEEHARFAELCRKHDLSPMTTCFAREHIESIRDAGFDRVKVASYDCASYVLLRELKSVFREVVISTGATFDDELETMSDVMWGHPYSLLHCVTIYPTPLEQANVSRINYLRRFTENVGFSDHSHVQKEGITSSKVAVHMGARIVERHFTVLDAAKTKDGPVSVRPEHLRELVAFSELSPEDQQRELDDKHPGWNAAVGEEKRRLSQAEMLNRDYYRGRFASRRAGYGAKNMIYNWEETTLKHG